MLLVSQVNVDWVVFVSGTFFTCYWPPFYDNLLFLGAGPQVLGTPPIQYRACQILLSQIQQATNNNHKYNVKIKAPS